MNRLLTTFVLTATAALAADNILTPKEKAEGWTLLFDGKTMNGWEDPRTKTPPGDAWTIEDGCLHATSRPTITEDLFTKRTFRDFELEFDWKIAPAGNSGVKYRIQDHFFIAPRVGQERFELTVERSFQARGARPAKGQDYVVGFEYQITDNAKNGDALSKPTHSAGALYDMVKPSEDATKPVGEFNHSRIVVRGKHIEHWMNGVKVVDSTLDSPDALAGIRKRWADSPHIANLLADQPVAACPISLQNHGDQAWFKNIRIR